MICYDRRAYGRSPVAEGLYSNLGDLLALFNALAVDRAASVGASSGGRLAVDFALNHPERVDALVLVGAVVGQKRPKYCTEISKRDTILAG